MMLGLAKVLELQQSLQLYLFAEAICGEGFLTIFKKGVFEMAFGVTEALNKLKLTALELERVKIALKDAIVVLGKSLKNGDCQTCFEVSPEHSDNCKVNNLFKRLKATMESLEKDRCKGICTECRGSGMSLYERTTCNICNGKGYGGKLDRLLPECPYGEIRICALCGRRACTTREIRSLQDNEIRNLKRSEK